MKDSTLSAIRTVLGPMTSEAKCREVYEAVLLSVRELPEDIDRAGHRAAVADGFWEEDSEYAPAFFTGAIDALLAE